MKNITKTKDCLACRSCCKFDKNDRYFAPIFTNDEYSLINEDNRASNFKKLNKNNKIFQVITLKSKDNPSIYVCPFYNEDTSLCNIYNIQPLDCKLWPFYFAKSKSGKTVQLRCFSHSCPSIKNINETAFNKYVKYLTKYLTNHNTISIVKHNPDLAWTIEPNTSFVKTLCRI